MITPEEISNRIMELETHISGWRACRERWPGHDSGPHLIACEIDLQLIEARAVAKRNGIDPTPIIRMQVGLIPDEQMEEVVTAGINALRETQVALIAELIELPEPVEEAEPRGPGRTRTDHQNRWREIGELGEKGAAKKAGIKLDTMKKWMRDNPKTAD